MAEKIASDRLRHRASAGVIAASLAVVGTAVSAKPVAQPTPAASFAENLSLDGTWQFAVAPTTADADALSNFYIPGADLSRFRPTAVPSNWVLQGFEAPHYSSFKGEASEGFYIRKFTVPASWDAKRVLLHFDGVWSSAEVWVNGQALGRVDSGFTRISFDVGRELKQGAENVVAVRVRQKQPSYLFDTNDDWSLGGIYRSVTLEAMPQARWIDRVETQVDFDDQYRDANLKLRVMIGGYGKRIYRNNLTGAEGDYGLRLTLLDAHGKIAQRQEIDLHGHPETGRETIATLHVAKPLHWTAETPNLYRVSVELLENGKAAHARMIPIGFREISTAGGVFRINGQAVKLRGVNRHDEHPDTGRATTPAQWLEDIRLMKAANINYIRLAHYPPAQGFLDLCDQLGVYVSDEVPMGIGGDLLDDPALAGAAMLRTYETVARDINHPSVVIWSVGNEDPLTSTHLAALRTVKALDPTRPVLMPWRAEASLPPEIDILAPHYLSDEKYDELASRADRPVVTTEYAHAYGNDGFGGLERRWKALTRHAAGAGGAIWMWADQGIVTAERKPDGSVTRSLRVVPDGFDGITDSHRKPTRDYWETQAVYAPVYPAVDAVDVVAGQHSVRVPIQNDFDFTDLSAVTARWTLMEDGKARASGRSALSGGPHAQSSLELPLDSLKVPRAGATYFYDLQFERADGSMITRRTVELSSPSAPQALLPQIGPVTVEQTPDRVTVRVGRASYAFDPRRGELVSGGLSGERRVTALRPTIWRPLNETEQGIVKREGTTGVLADLNRYTPSVREWRVRPESSGASIHAVVDYIVDAANRFSVAYDYAVDSAGRLDVRYNMTPEVQAKWLPQVGMELTGTPATSRLHWFGLGPYDAFPNLRAAPTLGLWAADPTRDAGTKAMRWAELSVAAGRTIRIDNDGYLAFGPRTPGSIQILSAVAGRPDKNRRSDNIEDRLDTDPGRSFAGRFQIRLDD